MLLGYLDPEDEVGSFTEDGFFRTGDLGRTVDGRFIVITGRKKDLIIRKGENIAPLEIENALYRHSLVRQAAVIGVPDAERGEMVVAYVVPRDGRTFGFGDMTAHFTSLGLARQKFPERLEIVEALPTNAAGKVVKHELKAIDASRTGMMGDVANAR
jgi:acyl-CoA synthetase (AMP-forming)/AMP-acid ligase II